MRFLIMVKGDKDSEAGVMPRPELMVAMGKYNVELANAGVLLDGGGLGPTSDGFRTDGFVDRITVTDGPFTEAREVVSGYWLIQVKSKAEAIEWATRIPFEGVAQVELRPLFELDDFPIAENESGWREEEEGEMREKFSNRPPSALAESPGSTTDRAPKLRYMLLFKANDRSEAGDLPNEEELTAMGAVMTDLARSGKLLSGEGLKASSEGARVEFSGGRRTVIDGPFTETKELVAGYSVVQVDSKQEAMEIARRCVEASRESVIETRKIFGEADFPDHLKAEIPEVFEKERELRARVAE